MWKFLLLFLTIGLLAFAPSLFAAHNVVLTWTPSVDGAANPTSGYNAFRGTTPGGESTTALNSTPIAPGCTNATSCTYTDTAVTAGQTYYYVLTFQVGSVQSAKSNEAPATIPIAAPTLVTATAN